VVCGALNAIHRTNERSRGHDPVTGIVRDAALVPAQTATVRVSRWFKTYVVSVFRGPRLARENQNLRAKVLSLQVENKQLGDAQEENDRLRALLDFQRKSPKPLLAAEVTALKPSPQTDTVILNRGINDGVHLHSIVVASNGALVGQVIDVSPHSSTALILTDAGSSVGAQVVPPDSETAVPTSSTAANAAADGKAPATNSATPATTGGQPTNPPANPADAAKPGTPSSAAGAANAPKPDDSKGTVQRPVGVCRGMGAGQAFLTYLRSDADIKAGDAVTTSGLGGVFPAGIPIGSVVSVKTDNTRSMRTAAIHPSADLDHLDEAFILR
jgi:cell shape-determining protein MreC